MPIWLTGLITLGCCLLGGVIVCVLFALGMKSGIEAGCNQRKIKKAKRHKNTNEREPTA